MQFKGTTPCKDCPYRIDAPLRKWDVGHFIDLLKNDAEYIGVTYLCHKNNGTVCKGWLMNQDERGFPCIALRVELSKQQITRQYLDRLHCKSPLYESVEAMVEANYPEL